MKDKIQEIFENNRDYRPGQAGLNIDTFIQEIYALRYQIAREVIDEWYHDGDWDFYTTKAHARRHIVSWLDKKEEK